MTTSVIMDKDMQWLSMLSWKNFSYIDWTNGKGKNY